VLTVVGEHLPKTSPYKDGGLLRQGRGGGEKEEPFNCLPKKCPSPSDLERRQGTKRGALREEERTELYPAVPPIGTIAVLQPKSREGEGRGGKDARQKDILVRDKGTGKVVLKREKKRITPSSPVRNRFSFRTDKKKGRALPPG